jgi:hypothetical protein
MRGIENMTLFVLSRIEIAIPLRLTSGNHESPLLKRER